MKQKAVVWDVDDVLTPTSLAFYKAALRTHGQCDHPDHWSDYLWGKHVGLDEGLATQQYLIEHRVIETAEPYDYTERALSLTRAAGYKNILLSARAWHPDPHGATREWMVRHVLDHLVHDMNFVKVEEPKTQVLERLCLEYDIAAFVEDNPVHVRNVPLAVPRIYLVRRGWNRECVDSDRITCVTTALEAAQALTGTLIVA